MGEALHIGHDSPLVGVECFQVGPTVLGVVGDVGEILCCVTCQCVPGVEGMLPSLCDCTTVLSRVVSRNLCQRFIQLSQCLPQQWQVTLAQCSAVCNGASLLIEERFDGDGFGGSLVEECR